MKIINSSEKLPSLKEAKKQKWDKEKLLNLAEKVGKILRKEGKLGAEDDENISSRRNAFSY